jgi:hypothetical protein
MADGIYTLLAQAQAEMPIPEAVKTGQQGNRKYKYVTLAQVLDIIRPPLNRRGIFLTQKTVMNERGMFIQTIVGHGDETLVLDEEPYEYQSSPQEYGKRETYAKRYSLFKAFGIVGDEDTDGNVQGNASRYQSRQQPQQAPQQASQQAPQQQAPQQQAPQQQAPQRLRPPIPERDIAALSRLTDILVSIGRDRDTERKALYAEYKRGGVQAAEAYQSRAMQQVQQPMQEVQQPYDVADEEVEV